MSQEARRPTAFRALHAGEPFLIPNPWDAGSARVLEALGFQALATTSSGFAFTLGRLDGGATLDEVAEHVRALAARDASSRSRSTSRTATATRPRPRRRDRPRRRGGRGRRLDRGLRPGAAGSTSFDARGRAGRRGGRGGARRSTSPSCSPARAENHLRGNPDLDDTIARLQAYERAGADVLYAPGLRDRDEIRAVCDAVDEAGERARRRRA